jgi:antitoxin (DNA-binding transcriptional repressor) of toxin-antitoxin stability system
MDDIDLPHINLGEAKRRWEEIMDALSSGMSRGYVICQRGKPAAMLLPVEQAVNATAGI